MLNKKIPFNVITIILVVGAIIGLYWLSRLGLEAGNAYLWLIFMGTVFILAVVFAKKAGADSWFELPIDKNNSRATLMFFIGFVTLILFAGASSLSGANFYSPFAMAPLASFGTGGFNEQSFAALSTATDPFWTFFIIVISASVIEEIVLGFAFVAMGSLIASGLRHLLKLDFGDSGDEHSGNAIWDFSISMIFSITIFAVLHFFNSTYIDPTTGKMIWGMFLWAAGFRLFLNIFMYKFGNFGLNWSIGVHALNNALYLGASVVFAALATFPGGWIVVLIMALFVYSLIISFKEVAEEGKEVFVKDFPTVD